MATSVSNIKAPASNNLRITRASESDLPAIQELIREQAAYHRVSQPAAATKERLCETLFGSRPAAEVCLAHYGSACVGYALFFQRIPASPAARDSISTTST